MNVLIDTNVVLDALLCRKPYEQYAGRIMALSEKGKLQGFVSASAVTDIFYVLKKRLNKSDAAGLINILLQTVHIAAVSGDDIREAFGLQWDDFEDSIQYVTGRNITAKYIITRNAKDFSQSTIEALTPKDFLSRMIRR